MKFANANERMLRSSGSIAVAQKMQKVAQPASELMTRPGNPGTFARYRSPGREPRHESSILHFSKAEKSTNERYTIVIRHLETRGQALSGAYDLQLSPKRSLKGGSGPVNFRTCVLLFFAFQLFLSIITAGHTTLGLIMAFCL